MDITDVHIIEKETKVSSIKDYYDFLSFIYLLTITISIVLLIFRIRRIIKHVYTPRDREKSI